MRVSARQRGFLLIAAVVIIMVAGIMALVIVTLVAGSGRAGTQHLQSAQALFLARTGLEHASRLLLSPVLSERVPCENVAGDSRVTNAALGTGTYTVTGGGTGNRLFYLSPPPTIGGGGLNATDDTVVLSSAAGLAPAGRVLVDREVLHYAEISDCAGSPCLLGVQRARDETTAAAHAAGTPIGQYQCDLVSVGGVPDASSPDGERTLSWGTQLQEGWIVGDDGLISRFNEINAQPAVHNVWQTSVSPVTVQLNSVYMLSYADGWAVGNAAGGPPRGVVLRWTGGAGWTQLISTNIPNNSTLNSVNCVSANDCWIVGDSVGGGPGGNRELILRWNGATLTRLPQTPAPTVNLNSVYCVATDDCWIVGDQNGGEVILVWDGTSWERFATSGIPDVNLNSVYCVASNDCWAVGDGFTFFGFDLATVLRWNGTDWNLESTAATDTDANLNSVHCTASDDCWAVGDEDSDGDEVILRWDGTAWSRSGPWAAVPDEDLFSVHCVDRNDCWAVGDRTFGGFGAGVIAHWDGTAWSRVTPPFFFEVLRSIHIIGDRKRADAAWREVFP